MNSSDISKLFGNKWVIHARWYYILGLVVIAFIANLEQIEDLSFFNTSLFLNPLFIIFALITIFNLWFYLILKNLEGRVSLFKSVTSLSLFQILIEIVMVALLLYNFYDIQNILPALFIIPIIESIVLFGGMVPLGVAVVASLVLHGLFVCQNSNLFNYLLGRESIFSFVVGDHIPGLITTNFILTTIFVVVGLLASYIAELISEREQILEQNASTKEVQLNELRNFNRELERSSRELSAKDLELTMANQRLEQLEQAKSKFITVTTHQLRTPLSAIKWTFNMLMSEQLGPLNAEQKDFLGKGYESSQRVISIVNDLLSMDRIESHIDSLTLVNTELDKLAESVAFEFNNQAGSKHINLKVIKPEKSLPVAKVDPQKIRMVIENLLDNAMKYTPENGEVTLMISDKHLNSTTPMIEVSVKDSGIGISPEDKSKIFTKFYRAPNAVKADPDGSGVGLFIAKDIVEKHHGTIWFESSEVGSIFYFTLPLR